MKKVVIVFLGIILITSCTKITEIQFEHIEEEGLVVNSFIAPQKNIEVNLSEVINILDTQNKYINNATISLFQNDKYVRKFIFNENGNYTIPFLPFLDSIYKLEIVYNDKFYYIQDTMPKSISIDSIVLYNSIEYIEKDDMTYAKANIFFTDPPEKNYYEIQIIEDFGYSYLAESDNEIIRNENIENYIDYYVVFSDELFNNSQCNFEIKYSIIKGNTDSIINICILRNVSYSYYMYKKTFLNHYYNQHTGSYGALDFFQGEPIEMFTNNPNGYGIFAAYNESTKKIL